MSGHLLRNIAGHLLRVDGRVYDQGVLLGELPTHLLRGVKTGNQIKYWYDNYQIYIGVKKSTISPAFLTEDEVFSAILDQYANQLSNVRNRSYNDCYSTEVKRYLDRGNGSEYTYAFVVRFWILACSWPSGYSVIPGIRFSLSVTGSNHDIEVRVKSSDIVRTGGSISNPTYSAELPSTLAGLQALPGGVFSGNANYDVVIPGPFVKKNRLMIIAYPRNMAPPYQIPNAPQPPSGAYIYEKKHSDFSAQGTVSIDTSAIYAVS